MAIARPLGQHWTFGHQAAPPAAIAVVPARGGIGPLIPAILCIGLILFAIAATIVLSLIPIYTRPKGDRASCTSSSATTTFGVQGNTIPTGTLSANNRAALQTALNQYVAGQRGFSTCSTQITDATAGSCSSQGKKRRRRRESGALVRLARQTNCNNQPVTATYTLYCSCTCIGTCLRQRLERLNSLLAGAVIPVNFPDYVPTAAPNPTITPTTPRSATSAMMG